MSLGQEGECGGPSPDDDNLSDALELERARVMVSLTGDLGWPLESVPDRMRRLLDAYWEAQYAIGDYIAGLGSVHPGESREDTERRLLADLSKHSRSRAGAKK